MRKLKLFLTLMLVAFLGYGQVWATEFTLSSESSVSKDGITVSFAKGSGSTAPTWYDAGLRLYASNTVTITCENDITDATFNWEKQGSKAFASATASTGTYSHPSNTGAGTWSGKAKSITFTLGSSGQLQLNTLSVTTDGGGGDPVDPTITFNNGSVDAGYTLDLSTLFTSNSNGEVTYSITAGGTYATIEGSVLTGVLPGSVTIQASQAATASYNAATANSTIIVNEHVVTPGEYTINLTNTLFGTTANANITSAIQATQDDITLVVDGTGQTKPRTDATYLRFYNGSSLTLSVPTGYNITKIIISANESDYSAPGVTVGAFNTSTKTWEGQANEVVWSFTAKSFIGQIKVTYASASGGDPAPEAGTITPDPTIVEVEAAGENNGSIAVSYTGITDLDYVEDVKIYSDAEHTTEVTNTIEWLTAIWNTGKTAIEYVVEANTGEARNAYIYLYAIDDNNNEIEKVIEVSQAEYVAPVIASLPFEFTGGRADIASKQGMSQEGLGTDYANVTTNLKFDGTGDYVTIHIASVPGTLTYDIVGNGFSGGTFKVQESANGETYEDSKVYTQIGGSKSNETINNLASTTRYIKFIYTNKSSGNVGLGNIAIAEYVAPAAVATPVIEGDENFVNSAEVTLTCETEGAVIYYTTDGTAEPSTSDPWVAYDSNNKPSFEETTTIYVAAKKENSWSNVASATFTKINALTTIEEIFGAATTAGDTPADVYVTFNNWVVSGIKGTNNAFVTDGTNGFVIFGNGHGFAVGNILGGTAACKVQLYKGSAELTNLTSSTTGLTVTNGGTVTSMTKTINQLEPINTGSLVTIENLTYDGTNERLSDGTNTIKPFNGLYNSMSFEDGKDYNVTGVVNYYDVLQIMPRSASDIVEIVAPEAPATPAFNPAAGTYTSVQSVEITCATEGATIYYTIDGTTTPTNESTEYTEAIEVAENMTIKAIAINANGSSAVATAVYTINLPEDEEVVKTWDLSAASYVSTDDPIAPTTDLIQWTATYVSMKNERNGNGNTAVNNYIPTTQTSTRFYKNNKLTITPNGKQITSIVFTATTNGYASALAGSTWTNATAAADGTTVTVTPTDGTVAISAVIGNTCGFTAVQVNYTAIDLTKPATPTFTPAAGEYTEVQSVTITCATEGANIYYTTNGDDPTSASTAYTEAISVGENMTIKAIAIKDNKSSAIAEAAYVINLPEDPETRKTWDLSVVSCDANPTDNLMQWSATYVTMTNAKGSGTKVTNYYPGTTGKSYTSTRFYNNNILTITPNGKQITSIVFTATTVEYASALQSSTWTNASAEVNGSTVTVTPEDGEVAISATIGGTCGFTAVQVNYIAIDTDRPAQPTFTPEADTYTEVQNVEISCTTEGVTIYYTTDGSTPSSTNGTEYTGAIEVAENMTIKAVAVKGEKVSKVATAAYVIDLPVLSTMQAVFNKATLIGGSEQTVSIAFDNWVVSGISLDEKNIYVTDGSKGFVIFVSGANSGFAVNDKLNGTVSCSLKLYKGFAEVVGLTANAEGLTVTHDGIVTPMVANIADLSAVNTGAPIILKDVEFDGSDLTDGTNTIEPYTTFYSSAVTDLELNKSYVVTGIYIYYNGKNEISPRSAADIEEIVVLRDENSGVTPGVMGTICPRQEVKYPTGASFYTISDKEEVDGEPYKVFFNEIAEGASLQAGVPYLFIADENSTAIKGVKVGDEATVAQKVNGLQGVLNTTPGYIDIEVTAQDVTDHKYYIIYDNQVRLCGEGTFRIRDERAYIIMDEIGTNPGSQVPGRRRIALSVWGQQNATGVDNVQGDNVQSTKLLINGQLFIIRGEKMYNANGQLVK